VVNIYQATASVEKHDGTDVLDLGTHRIKGERQTVQVPVGEHKGEVEQLREDSELEPTDEPLAYEVAGETRKGSWGQKLQATKPYGEMTDRQMDLDMRVRAKRDMPDDVSAGDIVPVEDLLEDPRTQDGKEQDALEEAAETGEEIVISKSTESCNDASRECNLDHVSRVATPDGEIETRRTHTY